MRPAEYRALFRRNRRRLGRLERGGLFVPFDGVGDAAGQHRRIVAALQHEERAPGAKRIRDLAHQATELTRRTGCDAEVADRVPGHEIVSGTHDEQPGADAFREHAQRRSPDGDERLGRDAGGGERNIHQRPIRGDMVVDREAGTGVSRHRVRGQIRKPAADQRLRAVPVMVVEVGDERALAGLGRIGARRDRRVIEQTEAHPARRAGVMTGRAHERERGAPFAHRALERGQRPAGRVQSAVVGTRIDVGIAGRERGERIRSEARTLALHRSM